VLGALKARLTGAAGGAAAAEAQGAGPCVVEPSCAPATLLAAESGEGVA